MQQRPRELKPQEVETIRRGGAENLCAERSGGLWQERQGGYRGARDLKADLSDGGQGAAHGDQHSAGADV